MGGGNRYDRESYAPGAGSGSYNSKLADYSKNDDKKDIFISFHRTFRSLTYF